VRLRADISDNGDRDVGIGRTLVKSLSPVSNDPKKNLEMAINNSVSRLSSPTVQSPIFVLVKSRTKKTTRVQSYRENP
jgi:hypothetical protein